MHFATSMIQHADLLPECFSLGDFFVCMSATIQTLMFVPKEINTLLQCDTNICLLPFDQQVRSHPSYRICGAWSTYFIIPAVLPSRMSDRMALGDSNSPAKHRLKLIDWLSVIHHDFDEDQ